MSAISTNSQRHAPECAHAVDSLPVSVCDNIRICRCRLYPLKEPGANAFRAYVPNKRRYFYGLRVHLVGTGAGEPVEFALAEGFEADVASSSSAFSCRTVRQRLLSLGHAKGGRWVHVLSKKDRNRLDA
jgi:hypothetical protein